MQLKLALAVVLLAEPLWAKFPPTPEVPLDRLIQHTQSVIREKPRDAQAYYILGRLYSLEFAKETKALADVAEGKAPKLLFDWPEERRNKATLTATDIQNAQQSLASYERAVELAPESARYHFSLGWMQQQCSQYAGELKGLSKEARLSLALNEYRIAYRLALPEDEKRIEKDKAIFGAYITFEAGHGIIDILKAQHTQKEEASAIEAKLKRLDRFPHAVDPLIFSLNPRAEPADLLSNSTVAFDLSGFASGHRWPWVNSGTCFLVWDPHHTGSIVSGRQLFGNVTWWTFWNNGLEPLSYLDDNRDGVLSGDELKGIAVWRDVNGNGIADPGEIVSAEDFGVEEIVVKQSEAVIKLGNGTRLNVFEWTPRSIN